MELRKIINLVFLACIPLLILGINLRLPVFLPCIILLVLRLATSDLDTAGVFLVMFGGPVGGLIRALYPGVPIYGMMLVGIGLLLLAVRINDLKIRSLVFTSLFIVFFALTFLYGPRSPYAVSKMVNICINGLLYLLAFRTIFVSKGFSAGHMAQMLLLTTVAMISFSILYYGFSGPSNIFDYTWMRRDSEAFMYQLQEHPITNYQIVGVNALYALTFILSQKKIHIAELCYFFPVCLHLVLTSGAKQAMFGVIIIILLKAVVFSDFSRARKWAVIGVSVLFVAGYLTILANDKVSSAAKVINNRSDKTVVDASRGINFLAAISCIQDHPIIGAGLGGYEDYISWQGDQFGKWPHNIILELLSETGVIGLVAVIFLVCAFLRRYKIPLRRLTRGGLYYFLIPAAMICRFMASSDLGESIVLFSAALAVSGPLRERKRPRLKLVFGTQSHKDHDICQ